MRSVILPAILVSSHAFGVGAFAATSMTNGVVKSVDVKTMIVTLEDGTNYLLPPAFKAADLKAGEKIQIDWQLVNKVNQAEKETVVK